MPNESTVQIIYDDECPVCRNYTHMLNLRRHFDKIELINARDVDNKLVREMTDRGYDLDLGMILKIDDSVYYGADAMHVLSVLATPSGLMSRLTYAIFRSPTFAKAIYPMLRNGRLLLLRVLGRQKSTRELMGVRWD